MATDPRSRDLAAIHATAKQLGMDEATYRAMLMAVAGVSSARDLSFAGRRQVLDHLRSKGGAFKRPAQSSGEWAFVDGAAPRYQPMLRKAIVLCRQLGLARGGQKAYCEGVMRRQHQVARHMEMMDWGDLHMLLVALERTLRFKSKNTPPPEGGIAA